MEQSNMKAADDLLDIMFRYGQDLVFTLRLPEWTLKEVSESFCIFVGLERKSVLGKRMNELRVIEDMKLWEACCDEVSSGKALDNKAFMLLDASGRAAEGILFGQSITVSGENQIVWIWRETTESSSVKRELNQVIKENEFLQDELRETRLRLEEVVDFYPDATLSIDNSGRITTWNKAIERMTGFKAEDMIGKDNYEYALPFYGIRRPILIDLAFKSDAEIQDKYHSVKWEDQQLTAEADVMVRGKERALWGVTQPLYNSSGDVIGAIESIRDITDRKRAQQQVLESEERFYKAFRNVDDTVAITFLDDGRFVEVSEAFHRILGYERDEIIGRASSEFGLWVDLKERDRIYEILQRNGRVESREICFYTKLRAVKVGLLAAEVMEVGNQRYGVWVWHDITERKIMEDALRTSEKRLYDIIDFLPDATFVIDQQGVITVWNRALEQMTGFSAKSMVGKGNYEYALPFYKYRRPIMVDLVFEPDLEIEQKYRRVTRQGDSVIGEVELTLIDGNRHVLWVIATALYDQEGKSTGAIESIRDITAMRDAEGALKAAHNELELKVEERTSELIALNQELMAMNDELVSTLDRLNKTQMQLLHSEKMAALGGLVAGMSHEISTPIGIAVTSVSYIQKELAQISKKLKAGTLKKVEFEEFILETSVFIQSTANNLERADLLIRSFKQISVDQTNEEKRRFNVKSYLEELLLSLNPLLRTQTHKVILECPENLELTGYPGLFAQMLTNFITNSLKHGFEVGFSGTIRIHFDKFGNLYTLTYSDNGKGMTEEVLEHVYDPFFTTKRGIDGGLGLGLNLVYNIVTQRLGGEIKCFSESGKGSNFIITFPDLYGE